MKITRIHAFGAFACLPLLLAGCSRQEATSVETLVSAIRAVGYTCGNVENSSQAPDRANWVVSCEDARSYIANVSNDGSICVVPLAYSDAVVPAPALTIPERCVPANGI